MSKNKKPLQKLATRYNRKKYMKTLNPFNTTEDRDFGGIAIFVATHYLILLRINMMLISTFLKSEDNYNMTAFTVLSGFVSFFYFAFLGFILTEGKRISPIVFILAIIAAVFTGYIAGVFILTLGILIDQDSKQKEAHGLSSRAEPVQAVFTQNKPIRQ